VSVLGGASTCLAAREVTIGIVGEGGLCGASDDLEQFVCGVIAIGARAGDSPGNLDHFVAVAHSIITVRHGGAVRISDREQVSHTIVGIAGGAHLDGTATAGDLRAIPHSISSVLESGEHSTWSGV